MGEPTPTAERVYRITKIFDGQSSADGSGHQDLVRRQRVLVLDEIRATEQAAREAAFAEAVVIARGACMWCEKIARAIERHAKENP